MLVPDRRNATLDHVRRTGSARIDDLAARFGVSAWTVRRDLEQLERDGLLRRTHGGAYLPQDHAATASPAPIAARAADGGTTAAKARIGARAASLIAEDSTVLVVAGSTTGAMLTHLRGRRLTVVTNGLDIANGLRDAPAVSVVVLGGMLHRAQMTLLGPLTEAAMAELHVDVIVAGAHGVDPDVGVTGAKIAQAGHHRGMLQHSDALIVLADTTKLGRRGPTLLAETDQVDLLITDTAAPDDEEATQVVRRLRERGVAVDIV